MKCGQCGTENPGGAKVCTGCGDALVVTCMHCGQENPKHGEEYDHNEDYISPEKRNGELFSKQRREHAEPGDAMKKAGHQSGGLNGTESFEQLLNMILSNQGTHEERIALLNEALLHGLPANDEIKAHAFLGAEFFNIGNDEEAIEQYERSLKLAANSGSMLKDNTMVLLCRKLCVKYIVMASKMKEERGLEECAAFLESKAEYLKDLSSPALYVELAALLAENGDAQKASIYFSKATICRTVDPMDRKAENFAWESLSKIGKTAQSKRVKMARQAEVRVDVSPRRIGIQKKVLEQIRESIASQAQNRKNLTKYLMAGVILGVLVIAGILVASYLSSTKSDLNVSTVPEKTEPPQQVEVPKLEETPEPLPEPLPAPATASPEKLPRTRPRETAKTAKTERRPVKAAPKISERAIDRPSEPQGGKSFAPRSRDDL